MIAHIIWSITAIFILAMPLFVSAKDAKSKPVHQHVEKATFAGGCFWCMESPFKGVAGVMSVTSGYTGGHKKNPTYNEVSSGQTGHAEAVQVIFDPAKVSYSRLLDIFWRNIDPTMKNGQFCDIGPQYRTAIFYHNDEQKRLAEASKASIEGSKRFPGGLYTEIQPASAFYPAEQYHQGYSEKNPLQYKLYRSGCRRDDRLQELWGSPVKGR